MALKKAVKTKKGEEITLPAPTKRTRASGETTSANDDDNEEDEASSKKAKLIG